MAKTERLQIVQEEFLKAQPDRKIKILIGTPCGGGQCSVQFMLSLMETFSTCVKLKEQIFIRNQLREGVRRGALLDENQRRILDTLEAANLIEYEIGLYTLSQESLLSRGRNHIASVAIRQGWDKLFFIDADAQWSWAQFVQVATAPHDFVAGACPLKVLPISLNFLPFEDDEHYFKGNIRSVASLQKMREGHKSPFVPVAFIGSAFMCLSRKVLLDMAAASEEYQYPNPATGHLHTVWNIFNTKPMHGKYMSEDWAACYLARELGYSVYVNADVIINHVGTLVYTPQMAGLPHKTQSEQVMNA